MVNMTLSALLWPLRCLCPYTGPRRVRPAWLMGSEAPGGEVLSRPSLTGQSSMASDVTGGELRCVVDEAGPPGCGGSPGT